MTLWRTIVAELRLFFTKPSWLSEPASGLATLIWGLLVLNSNSDSDWPSLDLFTKVGDSASWGVLGVILGLGQIFLFRGIDRGWRRPWLRCATAMLVAWIWLAVTMSTLQFTPWPPTVGASFAWWLVNIYLMFRAIWPRG